jgi:rhodanese-related sulfurtransferase
LIDQVRPADLPAWIQAQSAAAGSPAVVLAVREAWEVSAASVGARDFSLVHIPMNQIPARSFELDRQQPVAVLCHHGGRSQRVAMFLEQQGFARVANVAGGIDAWSREVDPAVPRY